MRAARLMPLVELLWVHDTCEGCAEMGVADACGRRHWGLRWSSYGATKLVKHVPVFAARTHARGATGAFDGAHMGQWGVQTWVARTHAGGAAGAVGWAPMGPRNV